MTAHAAEKVVFTLAAYLSLARAFAQLQFGGAFSRITCSPSRHNGPSTSEGIPYCLRQCCRHRRTFLRYVDEGLRLAECRYVQVCENVAQMLLGQCGANGTNGS